MLLVRISGPRHSGGTRQRLSKNGYQRYHLEDPLVMACRWKVVKAAFRSRFRKSARGHLEWSSFRGGR